MLKHLYPYRQLCHKFRSTPFLPSTRNTSCKKQYTLHRTARLISGTAWFHTYPGMVSWTVDSWKNKKTLCQHNFSDWTRNQCPTGKIHPAQQNGKYYSYFAGKPSTKLFPRTSFAEENIYDSTIPYRRKQHSLRAWIGMCIQCQPAWSAWFHSKTKWLQLTGIYQFS